MADLGKITNTSGIEAIMQFFLFVFCPCFQDLLFEKRKSGLSKRDVEALEAFIRAIRYRSASLGDMWWHTALRCERPIQARIRRVVDLLREWDQAADEKQRCAVGDEITQAIGKLGRTYRSNIHLIRHELDLKQLEADIKYFEGLRSAGLSSLRGAVESAIGEIFGNIRRGPEVIERQDNAAVSSS